ncbi:MAG TPA: alpha/beta hydrolase [Marmoricola sp.]|nr:alpha/beta hydrolase [Marmoricola sp.]
MSDAADRHASPEQLVTLPSGVELCFQTFGDPDATPLLLVMGLSGPMTWWPLGLCHRLVDEGFFVVRYDNRDTGRSTKLDRHRVSRRHLVRAALGRRVPAPYTLSDLAEDGLGILDHLGLRAAHVAGVSMGGMIAQTMAVEHPDRVLSLTSIMSTTGRRLSGYQDPMLLPALLRRAARTKEQYVEGSLMFWRRIASPGYPTTDEAARERAAETWDRGVSYTGSARQILAILTQADRTARLAQVRVPTTVVHGLKDRMVHVSGGRATARAIPGAELRLVPGMGHDIPEGLFDQLVDAISSSARRSSRAPSEAHRHGTSAPPSSSAGAPAT